MKELIKIKTIYFRRELLDLANTLCKNKDFIDVSNDLVKINRAITNANLYGDFENAIELDAELRSKYPEIDMMLSIVAIMPKDIKPSSFQNTQTIYNESSNLEVRLNQDKCGIYTHVLLKSKSIKEIKDFIEYVD